jgi:hypothetical protein
MPGFRIRDVGIRSGMQFMFHVNWNSGNETEATIFDVEDAG